MTQALVSDHGLLRWIELRHGIDFEDVRAELCRLVKPFVGVGDVSFDLQGVRVVMKGNQVLTVLPQKPGRKRKKKV